MGAASVESKPTNAVELAATVKLNFKFSSMAYVQ